MKPNPSVQNLFRKAALKSERLRIAGLLLAMTFLILFLIIRVIFSEITYTGLFRQITLLLLGGIGYEIIMLIIVRQYYKHNKDLPARITFGMIITESLLPTLTIFAMCTQPDLNPHNVLSAPVVAIYFLFLILSSLRLQANLSILAGAIGSLGYFSALIYINVTWPELRRDEMAISTSAHISFGVLIFLGGILAELVSRKMRSEIGDGILQLEKRQRMEADLDIARSIQVGLLPEDKLSLEHYDIAGKSWPADQAGGDTYDWLELPDGRWGIIIADVTGHGIGPALVTANCHAYVHAIFGNEGGLPDWLGKINRFACNDLDSGRFVTFLATILDEKQDLISFLSAGHGPSLLYKAKENHIEELGSQGLPMGIVKDNCFDDPLQISMEHGDILAIFTDGFFEWSNSENEQFGIERMKKALLNFQTNSSEEIIEGFRNEVLVFSQDSMQKDDLTAVVIKRR